MNYKLKKIEYLSGAFTFPELCIDQVTTQMIYDVRAMCALNLFGFAIQGWHSSARQPYQRILVFNNFHLNIFFSEHLFILMLVEYYLLDFSAFSKIIVPILKTIQGGCFIILLQCCNIYYSTSFHQKKNQAVQTKYSKFKSPVCSDVSGFQPYCCCLPCSSGMKEMSHHLATSKGIPQA